MSLHDDPREQLIHRVLDGEATAAEEQELATLLEKDEKVRILFDNCQAVHQACTDTIRQEILIPGKSAQEVIEAAREQVGLLAARPPFLKRFLGSQFASGLAAGLLLATLILTWFDQERRPTTSPLAQDPPTAHTVTGPVVPVGTNVQQRRDLYEFTDEDGNHWLVEGVHEETPPPEPNRKDL